MRSSRSLCWRSWAALGAYVGCLGAYVGGLGPFLGPMWAVWSAKCEEHGYLENVLISRAGARSAAWGSVLSRSWGLCWRSWAVLGPYVGSPEPLLGPMWAVLAALWPKLSILGGIRAEMWPKPEREGDLGKEPGPLALSVRRGLLRIFSVDIFILAWACRYTATELSDPVVWSSFAMLTGSMFCLCIFSSIFSIDGRS